MNVLQRVVTVTERDGLLHELELLLQNSDSSTIQKLARENVSPYKDLVQELCNQVDTLNVLRSAVDDLKSAQVLQITAARKLSDSTQSKIKDWFVTHVRPHIVLDISYDPSLIAGIQITYNGKYFDGSLNEAISNYMTESRMRELLFT